MKKKLIASTACISFFLSSATHAASEPTIFPQGIASGSEIKATDGTTQAVLTPNAANGFASLDSNANITSPIQNDQLFTGRLNSGVDAIDFKATFFNDVGDYVTNPNTILFGGHQSWDDAYLKIIGQTISHGDSGGAIVSEYNSANPFTWNRNGAGTTDGIIHYFGLSNDSPRLSLGQNIASSDGVTYTVQELKSDHITITPSLSAAAKKAFSPHTRIYSNYKTGNITNAPASGTYDHPFVTPNLYYTYYDSMQDSTYTDAAGNILTSTVISITYNPDDGAAGGWSTQQLNGTSKTALPPGGASTDYIDNTTNTSSDGVVYSYNNPAIFVGALGQNQFIINSYINGSGSQKDSVYKSASGIEWDFDLNMANDYAMYYTGETFAVNSHGHRFADGSRNVYLGGTGIPTMLAIGADAESTNIDGSSLWAGAAGFGDSNSVNADYRSLSFATWKYTGVNSTNGQGTNGHSLSMYVDNHRMVENTDGSYINPSDVAVEIGVAEDLAKPIARTSTTTGNMTYRADLGKLASWQGNWYLCPSGSVLTSASNTCTLTVANNAVTVLSSFTANGGISVGKGQGLVLTTTSTTDTVAPMLQAGSDSEVDFKTNTNQWSSVKAWGVTESGGGTTATTLTVSGQINNPAATRSGLTSTGVVGTQEFCTDCYSSSNSLKTLGIPVWWNGSTWVDALGQTAQY